MRYSVVISTYNRANLLMEAIRSVLGQTFRDFELIVVDDCSREDPKMMVDAFQDQRISYIRHEENKGDAATKNTGIKAARGDYIITLDDDDLFAPWALEELMKQFEKSTQDNLGGVYGWSWWTYGGETLRFLARQEKGNIFKAVLKNQIFTNILFKREVFETTGLYDETLESAYDSDFYLRFTKAYNSDFVPRILFVTRLQKQHHLSAISLSHMERSQNVARRFSQGVRFHGALILKFFPAPLYFKLSILKHKIATFIKNVANTELKKDIAKIQIELNRQGVKI